MRGRAIDAPRPRSLFTAGNLKASGEVTTTTSTRLNLDTTPRSMCTTASEAPETPPLAGITETTLNALTAFTMNLKPAHSTARPLANNA
jgi:hypothetical protein